MVKIHSLYVKYILPMMCEFQYWEFTAATSPVAGPVCTHAATVRDDRSAVL